MPLSYVYAYLPYCFRKAMSHSFVRPTASQTQKCSLKPFVCFRYNSLSLTKHPVIVFITISNTRLRNSRRGLRSLDSLMKAGLLFGSCGVRGTSCSVPNEPSNHSPAIRMSQGPLVHRAGNEQKKTSHYWTPVFSRLKDRERESWGHKIKTEKQL